MIPERLFAGRPVVIVAGGPSLRGFDFSKLARFHVIAINRALEFVPTATVLWWSDAGFWYRNKAAILAHPAPYKATGNLGYDAGPPAASVYTFSGRNGYDEKPGCLRHGKSSAYASIHLAAKLGAPLIAVLGLDMKYGQDGATHFHGGHGIYHEEGILTDHMLPQFEHLSRPLEERGVRVLNCCTDSALTIWPRCTIERGLEACSSFVQPREEASADGGLPDGRTNESL